MRPLPRLVGICCAMFAARCSAPDTVERVEGAERADAVGRAVAVDTADSGVRSLEERVLPLSPAPPSEPSPLEVEGFAPASHVGPQADSDWPKPVVIVLHGNFDRPEWECETWAAAASFRGWVLCPRGVRTPWATPAEDRWTYGGGGAVAGEIEAALSALERTYPGRVTREGTVLAGFSLGAILAPGLAEAAPGAYPYLFLVEGGVEKLDKARIAALARAGVRGIGLAMSAPGRREKARKALGLLGKAGIDAEFVDMKGAGHAYSAGFPEAGRAALAALLEEAVPDGGAEGGGR